MKTIVRHRVGIVLVRRLSLWQLGELPVLPQLDLRGRRKGKGERTYRREGGQGRERAWERGATGGRKERSGREKEDKGKGE